MGEVYRLRDYNRLSMQNSFKLEPLKYFVSYFLPKEQISQNDENNKFIFCLIIWDF